MKWPLIILSIMGIALFSKIIFFRNDQGSYVKPAGMPVVSVQNIVIPEEVRSGLPIRLKIPKINVDAPIEYVGVTSDGAMDVPKGPTDAAWFNLGPRPGERGVAVISGHYGWKNNMSAVFDDLHLLQKGEKVYIEDDKGATTTFVVRELQTYGENENASGAFGARDDASHLILITCEGIWNKQAKSYSNRLIVFADKEIK